MLVALLNKMWAANMEEVAFPRTEAATRSGLPVPTARDALTRLASDGAYVYRSKIARLDVDKALALTTRNKRRAMEKKGKAGGFAYWFYRLASEEPARRTTRPATPNNVVPISGAAQGVGGETCLRCGRYGADHTGEHIASWAVLRTP